MSGIVSVPAHRPALRLGFSSCPNDTAVFYALVHGLVRIPGIRVREEIHDVEELNRFCLEGRLDVSKVSVHALGYLLPEYALLRTGCALGKGCGPLLVARPGTRLDRLAGSRVGVPGRYTTAQLLLHLFSRNRFLELPMLFSEIMPAVARGDLDFGLIIHEGRFTYTRYGLAALLDLGAWWEGETGLPAPLGGIVVKRELGTETARSVGSAIRRSLAYYRAHPAEALPYIRRRAQELDTEVIQQHIDLYVTPETMRLSGEGERAVHTLIRKARDAGLIPRDEYPILAD